MGRRIWKKIPASVPPLVGTLYCCGGEGKMENDCKGENPYLIVDLVCGFFALLCVCVCVFLCAKSLDLLHFLCVS